MRGFRPLLLALVAAVLLPAIPAAAQEEDDRDRRLRELEGEELGKRLDEMGEQERQELLKKLRELKGKSEKKRRELRGKRDKAFRIARQLLCELPEEAQAKVRALPLHRQNALSRYTVERLSEQLRHQLFSSLTEREKARLQSMRGPERARGLFEIKRRQILDRLTPEQRAEIDRLPEPEKGERIALLLRRAHEADLGKARDKIKGEVERLLDLPEAELGRELVRPQVLNRLRHHGLESHARRLLLLEPREIGDRLAALDRLGRLRDPSARRAAIAEWVSNLPKIPQ